MDFDDLDEAEVSLGPTPSEVREELLAKNVPEKMPGAKRHKPPPGKGYGGGNFKSQKVLYLHGPGANKMIAEQQISAMFKNAPWVHDFKIFEWHYWEGTINQKVEEIHADPAVAQIFIRYGNKCGDTYDGYLSYIARPHENLQDETWCGPSRYPACYQKEPELLTEEDNFLEVMDALAKHLEETGPYDALCGFDMGGSIAMQAARLAQEGDERFQQKFRYLMLFSTNGPRDCAGVGQGRLRPEAPLQIPTFIGWSLYDDARPYPVYEHLCLYIHPAYRGVFYHDQGHRPPNIQKNTTQCEELDAFIGNMQADVKYEPTGSLEVRTYRDFWLPLLREPLQEVPPSTRRVLYVFTDPLGEHGPRPEESADRQRFPAQEMPQNCAMRLASYRMVTGCTAADFKEAAAKLGGDASVEVVEVSYSPAHREMKWHPEVKARDVSVAYQAAQGRSRWLLGEDEIIVPWTEMRRIGDSFLEAMNLEPPGEGSPAVGLVGLGTGAHVAFAVAEAMIRVRQTIPTRLWAVAAPTVWPLEGVPEMGSLVHTPIRYLTCPWAVTGPAWRLETATFGHFEQKLFREKEEMMGLVLKEMQKLGAS